MTMANHTKQPNILVILGAHIGMWNLSCYIMEKMESSINGAGR